MKKRIIPIIVSLLLAIAIVTSSVGFAVVSAKGNLEEMPTIIDDIVSGAISTEGTHFNGKATVSDKAEDIYENISINRITGVGSDPEEISGEASALGVEKQWYEYITYSPNPAASYRIDDDQRLIFYDPYDYSGAMIMKINNLETEYGTYSSISKTITQSNTIGATYTDGVTLNSSVQHQDGLDQTLSSTIGSTDSEGNTISAGTAATTSWSASTNLTTQTGGSQTVSASDTISGSVSSTQAIKTSAREEIGTSASVGASVGVEGIGSATTEAGTSMSISAEESVEISVSETLGNSATVGVSSTDSSSIANSVSASESGSDSTNISEAISRNVTGSESKTAGWSTVADRITTAIGSSVSTCRSWSNTESTSLTINYAATHFTDQGSPFSWNIAHYTVYMPMFCEKQYKVGDQWITTSSCYVILTTLTGTCRTWIQNSKVYYEDWGTGEAVTWEDFFSSFYTEENLINAYKNKLYPDS